MAVSVCILPRLRGDLRRCGSPLLLSAVSTARSGTHAGLRHRALIALRRVLDPGDVLLVTRLARLSTPIGALGVISKPFDPMTLATVVGRYLAGNGPISPLPGDDTEGYLGRAVSSL